MKIKDRGANIKFCCDDMKSNFTYGKFIMKNGESLILTGTKYTVYFCPFCGRQIKFYDGEPEPGHLGPSTYALPY